MTFLYFLPMLVAIAFVLARVARGGNLAARPGGWAIAIGVLAIVVLAVLGAVAAGMLR
jgi:hypothetical protein